MKTRIGLSRAKLKLGTPQMARNTLCIALCGVFLLAGCKDTREGGSERPRRTETREYDCRVDSKDKICEVPWKDKVVLYCYKDKIPKVVRYRWEC